PPRAQMGTCPGCCSVPASCAVRTEAVLLQQKTKPAPEPVGAPAPGANGCLPKTPICARRVRGSHRGGAPTAKTKTCPPEPVGAPAPGANECLPKTQICARFVRGSHRGGAPTATNQNRPRTAGAPAPGPNGALPAL